MDDPSIPTRHPLTTTVRTVFEERDSPAIFIRSGGETYNLRGVHANDVVREVLPHIDGSATVDEVVERAAAIGRISAARARAIVQWLIESGLCVEDVETAADRALRTRFRPQIRYFAESQSQPTSCQRRLQDSRVAVIGLEYLGSALIRSLASAGVGSLRGIGPAAAAEAETSFIGSRDAADGRVSRHARLRDLAAAFGSGAEYEGVEVETGTVLEWDRILAGCHLAAFALPGWNPVAVRSFNRACLERGLSFIVLWQDEEVACIGPLVVPGQTACLFCLELRRRSRWSVQDLRRLRMDESEATLPGWPTAPFLVPHVDALAAIAAGEIVTALSQFRRPLSFGHTLSVDPSEWKIQATTVLKVPRCPECGPRRSLPSYESFSIGPARS